jgi:hypothetical protein
MFTRATLSDRSEAYRPGRSPGQQSIAAWRDEIVERAQLSASSVDIYTP